MKKRTFTKQVRQFKYLLKKINRMLQSGAFGLLSIKAQERWIFKFKKRLKAMSQNVALSKLYKLGAVSSLVFGLSLGASAQLPTFDPLIVGPFNMIGHNNSKAINLVDIDGDGDLDFFAGKVFQENIGDAQHPSFDTPIYGDSYNVGPFNLHFNGRSMDFADMDNDGDYDMIQVLNNSNPFEIAENIGTSSNPMFGDLELLLPGNLSGLSIESDANITLTDIDQDGDLDIVSSYAYIDEWYNDGDAEIYYVRNEGDEFSFSFNNIKNSISLFSNIEVEFDFANADADEAEELFFIRQSLTTNPNIFYLGQATDATFEYQAFDGNVSNLPWKDIELADIDNDGDQDLFGLHLGHILFHENTTIDNNGFPPSSQNMEIFAQINESYHFKFSDFPFIDTEDLQLESIKITTLPTEGTLEFNSLPVTLNQEINMANISSLHFSPVDQTASPYSSFEFQVSNGVHFSNQNYTASINVCGLELSLSVLTPLAFPEATNACLEATISGGTSPYNYDWGFDTGNTVACNLSAGHYQAIVTDTDGCQVKDEILLGDDQFGNCITDINITNQLQIDHFFEDYPTCTSIKNLVIDETMYTLNPITNLNGLSQLTSVKNLIIKDNPHLINLQGLQNITTVEENFFIEENTLLVNLGGIENLISIGNNFELEENTSLVNLNGIENLTNISGRFFIKKNRDLVDLTGLTNLTSIGDDFEIQENDALVNLNGLDNLLSIGKDLIIGRLGLCASSWNWYPTKELIGNPSLFDLTGLESLSIIGGNLEVYANENLSSFNGLNNLTTINGSIMFHSNNIQNCNSLENLTTLGQDLLIGRTTWCYTSDGSNDYALGSPIIDLTGLENLTTIPGNLHLINAGHSLNGLNNLTTIGGEFLIYDTKFTDLSGLDNLTTIGGLLEIGLIKCDLSLPNESLISLEGLENLISLGDLSIVYNNDLNLCNTTWLCNHLSNGGSAGFYNNGDNCSDKYEIQSSCLDLSAINYEVYFDLNQNGERENNEPLLPNAVLDLDTDITLQFPFLSDGTGIRYLPFGDYHISFDPAKNPNWDLTSDATIEFTIDENNTQAFAAFGIYPETNVSEILTLINAPSALCNEILTFNLNAKNEGTTIVDGTLWFKIDKDITAINFIDPPDVIISPDLYGWHFESLPPGQYFTKQIDLTIPGEDEFTLGNQLKFIAYTDFEDINGNQTSTIFKYLSEVQCTFNLRNKIVNPNRPNNQILAHEELIYTIRFRNQSTAKVLITDYLDVHLDWSSFTLLSTSHPDNLVFYSLEDGVLTFEFRDISPSADNNNSDDSEGYISFRINPLDSLEEYTVIENKASIYQYGSTSSTNTTESIIVNEILNTAPASEDCSIVTTQDMTYNFTGNDFPFNDYEDEEFSSLKIVSLPNTGELTLGGNELVLEQEILADEIEQLQFTPLIGELGEPYTSFDFRVFDGEFYSDISTLTINVIAFNNLPLSENLDINIYQNTSFYFVVKNFDYTDVETDEIAGIRINSLPNNGILEWNGVPVMLNQEIQNSAISMLQFSPAIDETGAPYASFDFSVFDGLDYSETAYTVTVNVLSVTSTSNQFSNAGILVSPNPTTGEINIKGEKLLNAPIQIIDARGKLILNQNLDNTMRFDLSEFPSGVYFLSIKIEDQVVTKKIVLMD